MTARAEVPLAPHTSLGVGGPARFFVEAKDDAEVQEAAAFARTHGLPLKIIGKGTNILVPDAGVEAVVLAYTAHTLSFEEGPGGVCAVAEGGASWDAFVGEAVRRGLWGVENLSGIPGTLGAAVVGNIGAYGAAVSDTITWVEALDLETGARERLAAKDCAFGYRTSVFKTLPGRLVVRAGFRLGTIPAPKLSYRDLAEHFGARTASVPEIREAVLAIRATKFPDLTKEGSAGSFFKNVILSGEEAVRLQARYPEMPLFSMPETAGVKVPVAWLLDHVLGLKGYVQGNVRLFEQQPLVIVAARDARAAEVDALARDVEARMQEVCGITLEREVETFTT